MINKNWKELIKPKKIEFTKNQDNAKSAELVDEPLESGYGQTLGNMLRRVLLSSIRGAAVHLFKLMEFYMNLPLSKVSEKMLLT